MSRNSALTSSLKPVSRNSPISRFICRRLNETKESRYDSIARWKRKSNACRNLSLDTRVISSVIDDYIMPMFGTSTRSSDYSGSVYSELKLSSRLHNEKEQLNQKHNSLIQEVEQVKQSKYAAETEYFHSSKALIEAQTSLQFLNFQYELTLTHQQTLNPPLEIKHQNVDKLTREVSRLSTENEKLKDQVVDLQHTRDLLTMHGKIVGEKLKGLYESLKSLESFFTGDKKSGNEYYLIVNSSVQIVKEYLEQNNSLYKLQLENQVKDKQLVRMSNLNDRLENHNKSSSKHFKDKVKLLTATLVEYKEDNERLNNELEDMKERYNVILKEFKIVNEKLKKLRAKASDEKYCKNCQKNYTENENYNWSCKTHKCQYSGTLFFCCGQSDRSAPGCITTKHEPRSDDLDEFHEELKFCSNCKQIGHRSTNCPRDPNVRTPYIPEEESNRIKGIKEEKEAQLQLVTAAEFQKRLMSSANKVLRDFSILTEGSEEGLEQLINTFRLNS